ncbi:hypothetical protein FACS1894120_5720 [Clostridia bacterium]|nr:hypothetical protein FACS1894120_5720 [Clostridia bacterium]
MEITNIVPLLSVVVASIACFTAISRSGRQDSAALTNQIATLMATLEFIKQQISDISGSYGNLAKVIVEHSREIERLNIQHEGLRHDVDRAYDKMREMECR